MMPMATSDTPINWLKLSIWPVSRKAQSETSSGTEPRTMG